MSNLGGSPLAASPAPDTGETPRPAPSRLVLARHGESTWNAARRIQGQLDPPLSERGLDQAGDLAVRLANSNPVALYSSDLCRARQTALPAAEALGLEPVYLSGLREIALGGWEGKTTQELAEQYPVAWAAWTREPAWDLVPDGEGAEAFQRRVEGVVNDLLGRHAEGDIICVTHGGVIQVVLAMIVGRGIKGLFPFLIENGSLTVVQRTGDRLVVTAVNDTCHLQ